MAVVWYPHRHEEPRCSISFREGPSRPAAEGGAGGSGRTVADRGCPTVWGGARHGDSLDGVVATAGNQSLAGPAARTAAPAASDGPAGSPGRAADREPIPGTVAVALRAVDAGSDPTVVGPAVWGAGFGLDGGPVPACLGLTPQKPARQSYEQDPVAVQRWLAEEYPAIRAQARREKAQIHWLDEMGLRSDHQAGRSWGLRGQTPVVPGTGQRFRCNMISAITNRGRLAFMVFRQRFTARVFLEFLRRLRRLTKRKLYLIADRHPVHRAARVKRWLAKQARQVRLFWLPPYSPELNPDELLNQDVKTNAVGRMRPRDEQELVGNIRSYLRITQGHPQVVQRYFRERHVQYAAL